MPLINVKLIEGVFSREQKQQSERLTDAMRLHRGREDAPGDLRETVQGSDPGNPVSDVRPQWLLPQAWRRAAPLLRHACSEFAVSLATPGMYEIGERASNVSRSQ